MSSLNIISRAGFLLTRPKIVLVAGEGSKTAREAILAVLKAEGRLEREVLVREVDLKMVEEMKFFVEKSSLPILVVSQVGEIPPDRDFFAGPREKTEKIRKMVKVMPGKGALVLNFDDETVRELKGEALCPVSTFGFQSKADFWASDVRINGGTNFKVNREGNIIPVWLEKLFGKEQIYAALSAMCVGEALSLNLIETSQALREYKGLPGIMRLTPGIKNSWILDDSASATVFSMMEALDLLSKIVPPVQRESARRIAVLGDIIGIGKYTIEAHEAIGEKVRERADLLFTFGERAKFIAQGAQTRGMPLDKIFSFDRIEDGKLKLQEEIKEGDLVLVDGSKEMAMDAAVEEIKAFVTKKGKVRHNLK